MTTNYKKQCPTDMSDLSECKKGDTLFRVFALIFISIASYSVYAAGTLTTATDELLNSGYLVVTVLVFFILFLILVLKTLHQQNVAVTNRLMELNSKNLVAFLSLEHTIELLATQLSGRGSRDKNTGG